MFAWKSTKPATRIVVSLLGLLLMLTVAFLMKSAWAFRNRPPAVEQRNGSLRKVEINPARIIESRSAAQDKTTIAEVGVVPSTRGPRYVLSFVDDQLGWFADDSNLWRTTDGGHTWNLLLSSDHILGVFFSNRQVGWLERINGIHRTEDGGKKWAKISTPLDDAMGAIAGVYFLNNGQIGWLAGGQYKPVTLRRLVEDSPPAYLVRSDDNGSNAFLYQRIFKTNDGGNTWRKQSLPDEVGEIFSLHFADDMRGVALGGNEVFFTKHGGREWQQAALKPECVDPEFIKFPDSRPRAVAFVENNAWLSYDNGRVLKSIDGGESWCDLLRPGEVWDRSEPGAFFRQLYFIDSTKGWGLQDNGKLFKTEDGGRVWSPIDIDGERIWEVQFFKDHALLVTKEKLLKMTY